MTTSLIENIKNGDSVVIQSLDGSNAKSNSSQESTPRMVTPNPYNGESRFLFKSNNDSHVSLFTEHQPTSGGPLTAASKMVPVPETLMSPDICPSSIVQRVTVSAINTQIQQQQLSKNIRNKGLYDIK